MRRADLVWRWELAGRALADIRSEVEQREADPAKIGASSELCDNHTTTVRCGGRDAAH